MKRSADSNTDEVLDKLSTLKTLLEELEAAKLYKSKLTKDLEDNTNSKGHNSAKLKENSVDYDEDNSEDEDEGRLVNMKKVTHTLTPEQKLQMLKSLVQEFRNAKAEDMANEGSFAEKAVQEDNKKEIVDWKELAELLENERDNQPLQNTRQKTPHIVTETKEGTFGEFKDEIKYAVEKNLLTDVALAIHSGISVEELLSDITGQVDERS